MLSLFFLRGDIKKGEYKLLPMFFAFPEQKNENLLEQIYGKYYGTMLFVANSILKDNTLAEDTVAEAFIKINRNIDKLKDISCHQTKGYIVSTVQTLSYDAYNKRTRRKEDIVDTFDDIPDERINILDDLQNQDSCASLIRIIKSLPTRLKEVAYLYASGYNHDEIAQTLGISYANSKKRLSRARKMAQKIWAGEKNEK